MQHLALLTNSWFTFDPPQKRSNFKVHPEIRLLALLVVIVKLFNPFDQFERYARSSGDPGFQAIDWSLWDIARQRARTRIEHTGPFAPGGETQLEERDVFGLSDRQIDAYLDWYDDLWTDTEHRSVGQKPLPDELLKMFPTARSDLHPRPPDMSREGLEELEEDVTSERLKTVQGGLKSLKTLADDNTDETLDRILRIGDAYIVYEVEADLPDMARTYFSEVAEQAAMSLETLVDAVSATEKRIFKEKYDILGRQRIRTDSEEESSARLDFRLKANKQRLKEFLKETLDDPQRNSLRSSPAAGHPV